MVAGAVVFLRRLRVRRGQQLGLEGMGAEPSTTTSGACPKGTAPRALGAPRRKDRTGHVKLTQQDDDDEEVEVEGDRGAGAGEAEGEDVDSLLERFGDLSQAEQEQLACSMGLTPSELVAALAVPTILCGADDDAQEAPQQPKHAGRRAAGAACGRVHDDPQTGSREGSFDEETEMVMMEGTEAVGAARNAQAPAPSKKAMSGTSPDWD